MINLPVSTEDKDRPFLLVSFHDRNYKFSGIFRHLSSHVAFGTWKGMFCPFIIVQFCSTIFQISSFWCELQRLRPGRTRIILTLHFPILQALHSEDIFCATCFREVLRRTVQHLYFAFRRFIQSFSASLRPLSNVGSLIEQRDFRVPSTVPGCQMAAAVPIKVILAPSMVTPLLLSVSINPYHPYCNLSAGHLRSALIH